jgi:hypothetical protein
MRSWAHRYVMLESAQNAKTRLGDPGDSATELVRARRGMRQGELRDSADAELYAQEQPWYDRILWRGFTQRWWVWRLRKEG